MKPFAFLQRRLPSQPPSQRVVEHAAGLVDPDDAVYRPLSGHPETDELLGEVQQTRQRRQARVFFHRNPVGGALIDSLVAKALGEGASFQAREEAVQAVVDRFTSDPDNQLECFLPLYAKELLALGELALPIFLTPEDASVRLGYLLPEEIERVVFQRGDRKKPLAFLQRRASAGDVRRLWVIPSPEPRSDNRYSPHPALTPDDETGSMPGEDGFPVSLPADAAGRVLPEIQELLDGGDVRVAGYAFYHRHGNLVSGRGRSLFERIADWLPVVDTFLFNQFRNAILQGHMLWHVRITGANRDQVEQRQRELGRPPRPGSLLVTNEQETWEAVAPKVTPASQIKELLTSALKLIGLSVGLPGHEVGAEDDVNRSTAGESRSVSVNRAKSLQKELTTMVRAWIGYQVDQKRHRGLLPADLDLTVDLILPEVDVRDQSEVAAAVKTTVDGMITAVDRNLVLLKDARAQIYAAMGLDLPTEEEFAAQEREREELRQDPTPDATSSEPRRPVVNYTGNKIWVPAPSPTDR